MDLDSNIENRFTDIELEGFTKISKLIEDKIYVKF